MDEIQIVESKSIMRRSSQQKTRQEGLKVCLTSLHIKLSTSDKNIVMLLHLSDL